jgi:hypothetical protein
MSKTEMINSGTRVYPYDEVQDQKVWSLHRIDFIRAFDATAVNAGGPLPSMAFIEEVLERLDCDWDDDADGVNSYWLKGRDAE